MKERKGSGITLFFSIFLLLSGCAIMLYPHINALWMDHVMRRDAEEFLSFVEVSREQAQQGTSHIVSQPEDPGPVLPEEYSQLWLDMKAYNESIFEEGQEGLANQSAYEAPSFLLSEYGLESEVFGVISIPKLEQEMPLFLGASKTNMAKGAAVMGQTSLPIGGRSTSGKRNVRMSKKPFPASRGQRRMATFIRSISWGKSTILEPVSGQIWKRGWNT